MTIKNATQPSSVRIVLDPDVVAGLNRARRRERQSAAVYIRTMLVRALSASGDLATDTKPEAGR